MPAISTVKYGKLWQSMMKYSPRTVHRFPPRGRQAIRRGRGGKPCVFQLHTHRSTTTTGSQPTFLCVDPPSDQTPSGSLSFLVVLYIHCIYDQMSRHHHLAFYSSYFLTSDWNQTNCPDVVPAVMNPQKISNYDYCLGPQISNAIMQCTLTPRPKSWDNLFSANGFRNLKPNNFTDSTDNSKELEGILGRGRFGLFNGFRCQGDKK